MEEERKDQEASITCHITVTESDVAAGKRDATQVSQWVISISHSRRSIEDARFRAEPVTPVFSSAKSYFKWRFVHQESVTGVDQIDN